MNAFKRGKRGIQSIYVPTKTGGLVQRSTGTVDPRVVRGMKRMVREFKDSHRWDVVDALTIPIKKEGKRPTFRLDLSRAYVFYVSNQLDILEAELSAKDLTASLDGWIAWVRAQRRDDVRTPDVYWQQVTTLVDPERPMPPNEAKVAHTSKPYLASLLTKESVMTWLTGRTKASSGTRRKYFYALKSFIGYCVDTKVYAADPLAGFKGVPKKNPSRERWVTTDVDERIVKAANPEYRALFAFIKGTGCDVGSALRAQVGDVNVFSGRADIRGTKTPDRPVPGATLEAWALPYVRRHLNERQKEGTHALLFPGVKRNAPSKHHSYLCQKKLGIEGYTLKDARHSVGVRMRLAGRTFEEIAAQLGTSVHQAVTVYTKFKPEDAQAKEEAK